MNLDDDLDAILSTGDFDTTATFAVDDSTVCVNGIFTKGTDAVTMFGQVEIEAQNPSLTVRTDDISDVGLKGTVTVYDTAYIVERKQNLGTGFSLVYLKTKVS